MPADVNARLVFARALGASHQNARAAGELKALAREYPGRPDIPAALGTLLLGQGQWADARRSFEAALVLDPNSVEATTGLVNVDIAVQRPADARARLDTRMSASADPTLNIVAAATYVRLGDMPRAEELLLKTIAADPGRLPAYVLLGRIYLSQKRLDDAKKQLETLLAKEPTSVGAVTMLGMILEAQGKPAESEKMYERALELDPAAPVAANNLAWMYANSGRNLDIALQLAQTAKRRLPDEPHVSDTLGWVYYKKNMAPQAISAFELSTQRAPASADFLFHLGLAHAKAGHAAAAKDSLSAALKLNPGFTGADEARRLIAAGVSPDRAQAHDVQ